MKIAFISDGWVPFPGGAERYIFNIARELKNRGHEICVLTSYMKAYEFDGIKPTWISIGVRCYDHQPGHTHADGWRDIKNFLDEHKPDVIVTHHFFAREFEKELFDGRIPVVNLMYNGARIPNAALTIYISQHVYNTSGGRPGDMLIMPPAFEDVKAETHGDFVGFIKPIKHKGIDLVYQIAELMPEKQFLVLRGEWQDIEDIRRGRHNVFFMEPVHDMRTFYEKCRVMLVPSTSEDAGTVAQEAALNEMPCISSGVMGLSQTNGGGIILPPVPSTWVATIRDLDNPEYYALIVERQKQFIASLNWPGQFDELSGRICQLAAK